MKQKNMLLLVTTILTGLIAGLFYSWTVSVTKGLALLSDREYITSFQALNIAIINPAFLICFMGLILLLPACTWFQYHLPSPLRFRLLLAASIIYIIGVMGVTFLGNIPMNESLKIFNTESATAAEMAAKRLAHESRWNLLNNIRTFSSILCLALTVMACMTSKDAREFSF